MSVFNQKAQLHPGREGFDLSKRVITPAAPGMLLPLYCKLLNPGDYFEINVADLTRLQPLNTAAFARIDEHFDFFKVPCNDLWRYYDDWFSSIPKSPSVDIIDGAHNFNVPSQLPYITLGDVYDYLSGANVRFDELNYSALAGSSLLLSLLGYGVDAYLDEDGRVIDLSGANLYQQWRDTPANVFPLLAYQKVYEDFYRRSQWEELDSSRFNIDYSRGGHITLLNSWCGVRYANLKKDYFLGLYPNQQFGDVTLQPLGIKLEEGLVPDLNRFTQFTTTNVTNTGGGTRTVLSTNTGSSSGSVYLQANLNILEHRVYCALQRWKEVFMCNGKRFKEQVKAMYGVDVPERRNRRVEFVDGFTNTIQIGEVVATAAGQNSANQSELGQIGGKAVGATSSNKVIKVTNNDEPCYLMCIYHCEPRIDYNAFGVHPDIQMTEKEDFYSPVFDGLYLSPVYSLGLSQVHHVNSTPDLNYNVVMGYGSRYLNYKTDFDTIHSAFTKSMMNAWVVPYSEQDVTAHVLNFNYRMQKVSPHCLDQIMTISLNQNPVTMPLMLNCNFDIKAVRNMKSNSIPY